MNNEILVDPYSLELKNIFKSFFCCFLKILVLFLRLFANQRKSAQH